MGRLENYFYTGELYYNLGTLYQATADGVSGANTNSNVVTAFNLEKVSGSGSSTITLGSGIGNFDGNPLVMSYDTASELFNSGYELYDSDSVKVLEKHGVGISKSERGYASSN